MFILLLGKLQKKLVASLRRKENNAYAVLINYQFKLLSANNNADISTGQVVNKCPKPYFRWGGGGVECIHIFME